MKDAIKFTQDKVIYYINSFDKLTKIKVTFAKIIKKKMGIIKLKSNSSIVIFDGR